MFFRRNKEYAFNIDVDMHSHILPGVDDGVRTVGESLNILRGMQDLGLKKVCLTPHIKEKAFPNTPESLRPVFESLQAETKAAGINVELSLAAEYYLGPVFRKKLESGEKLLTVKDSFLLVEASMYQELLYLQDFIFKIRERGYTPILAHPERYGYYPNREEPYRKLKRYGCLFQMNLFSLSGHHGKAAKARAEMLLDAGMIDFAGGDIHGEHQLKLFRDKTMRKKIAGYEFRNDILR